MADFRNEVGTVPDDRRIGDDGDAPGISQEYTLGDLQSVAMSHAPQDERLGRLREMRDEIYSRGSADRGSDFETLLGEADRLIDQMATADASPVGGFGDVTGSDEPLSTLSPEERAERISEQRD